ncbi:MAG: hypothetical protein B7X06_00130 [Verrucomicrobia bacterium 21-51-4]|nr:MAG: hypothetical protein B7X06_00130 [Verrucomicrobia bacterium 21-51-4]HQU09692.1 hypothetical protein [Opitutales bacterium]
MKKIASLSLVFLSLLAPATMWATLAGNTPENTTPTPSGLPRHPTKPPSLSQELPNPNNVSTTPTPDQLSASFNDLALAVNDGATDSVILQKSTAFADMAQARLDALTNITPEQRTQFQTLLTNFRNSITINNDMTNARLTAIGVTLSRIRAQAGILGNFFAPGVTLIDTSDASDTEQYLNSVNGNNPNNDLLAPVSPTI